MANLTLIRGGACGKTAYQILEAAHERLGNAAFRVYQDAIARNRIKTVDCATGLPARRYRSVTGARVCPTKVLHDP